MNDGEIERLVNEQVEIAKKEEREKIFNALKCPECNECETIEDAWNMLCEHIEKVKKEFKMEG